MRTQQKLLYVVNEAYYFLSHYSALAQTALEAGYEVHVAAPDDHVWAPDGFGVQDVCDRGFGFHAIPLSRRGQNPLQDMRTAAALLGLYRRLRPDLVHHLTIKPVLYGGIASRVARIPAAVSAVTGLGQVFVARGLRAAGLRALVRLGYRIAMRHPNARVIVQNSADGETLASAWCCHAESPRARERVGSLLDQVHAITGGWGHPTDCVTGAPHLGERSRGIR